MNFSGQARPPQALEIGKAYFTEKEVAERLSMSVKWLQKMRVVGGGIPFVKIGGSVRYAASDIMEFESIARRASTSEYREGGVR